jgi:uncharacterized protein (TIGR00251 family)
MRVSVKVQPRASKEEVIKNSDGSLKVYVRQPPTNGKANQALIEILADFYCVRKSDINIITGKATRNKIIEIG